MKAQQKLDAMRSFKRNDVASEFHHNSKDIMWESHKFPGRWYMAKAGFAEPSPSDPWGAKLVPEWDTLELIQAE